MNLGVKGWTSKNFREWNLKFFESGEWQVIQERLNDLNRHRQPGEDNAYAPRRVDLFNALDGLAPADVRVGFVGQDPYPSLGHACGLAFSCLPSVSPLPQTLKNIFKEYCDDLGHPEPTTGDLSQWVKQGVFLWNAYPSVQVGKPGSHHWEEWGYLTKSILDVLSSQGSVIVYFGRVAETFAIPRYERQLFTSHPSPLGAKKGFLGSRIFSRINDMLDQPLDWRLP